MLLRLRISVRHMIMIRIKGIEALPQVINEEDGKIDYVETKPIKISDLSSAGYALKIEIE